MAAVILSTLRLASASSFALRHTANEAVSNESTQRTQSHDANSLFC